MVRHNFRTIIASQFLLTVAAIAAAQENDTPVSEPAVIEVDTATRLIEWATLFDARWNGITPSDADGGVTISNMSIPIAELNPQAPALRLTVPELEVGKDGDVLRGQMDRILVQSQDRAWADVRMENGVVWLGDPQGRLHFRAEGIVAGIPYGTLLAAILDRVSPERSRQFPRQELAVGSLAIDIREEHGRKRLEISLTDLTWNTPVITRDSGTLALLEEAEYSGRVDSLRLSLIRTAFNSFQLAIVVDRVVEIFTNNAVTAEISIEDITVRIDGNGDGFLVSSTTSGGSAQLTTAADIQEFSAGPGTFTFSNHSGAGITMNVRQEGLRPAPHNAGDPAAFPGETADFHIELAIVPGRPFKAAELMRRLQEGGVRHTDVLADLAGMEWLVNLRSISLAGFGVALDGAMYLTIDPATVPVVSGSGHLALGGFPAILEAIKSDSPELAETVADLEDVLTNLLVSMSAGQDIENLRFEFSTDEAGGWLVNGRPLGAVANAFLSFPE